jgi:putative inorganic carbon (hco3(-)) transporter
MNWLNSSFFFGLLNKLDVQSSSFAAKAIEQSFFIKSFNKSVETTQNLFSSLTDKSFFVKNIDTFILFLISSMIISINFASTGILGLLTILAFGCFVIKLFLKKGEKYTFNSFDIPIFLYLVIAGLSVAYSSFFMPSLKGYVKMIIYIGGYLTFFNILKDNPRRTLYLMSLLALNVSVEACIAIKQQILGIEPLASWQDIENTNPEQLMNRVYGTLKPYNPNLLAGYLVAGFSSVIGTAFVFLNRKHFWVSTAFFACTFAVLAAIMFTGSRGAYIAVFAMVAVFVMVSGHFIWNEFKHIKWLKKLWVILIILAIAAVVLLILSSPSLQHRIASIFVFRDDSSNSYRFNVYNSCFQIIKDNFWTGIGQGNTTFRLVYGLYMITGFDALGAYSVPLELAVESGIWGLLSFSWLIFLVFIKGIKSIYSNMSIENKIIISSCIIGIIGLMVHGVVDTVFYRPQIQLVFWLLIAILATKTKLCEKS